MAELGGLQTLVGVLGLAGLQPRTLAAACAALEAAAEADGACAVEVVRWGAVPSHAVAASITRGHSLGYIRSRPALHTAAGSVPYGDSLRRMRLQPPLHTATASVTYGHRPHHIAVYGYRCGWARCRA